MCRGKKGGGDKKVGADISLYDMGFLCVDSYLGFIGFKELRLCHIKGTLRLSLD